LSATLRHGLRYLYDGAVSRLGRGPMFLTVFVTARCPLRCGHCFYRAEADAASEAAELTLTELRLLANRLPPVPKLILTGGEPFLRRDLTEIAAAFYDGASRVQQITIPTAGLHANRTAELVRALLSDRPGRVLEVQLSIDGVGAQHDAIRGPGTFERLVQTYRTLAPLARTFDGLAIRFNFTFSRPTQGHFGDVFRYVTEELGHPQLDMVLVRKATANAAYFAEIDMAEYRRAAQLLQTLEERRGGRLQRALAQRVSLERDIVARHYEGRRALEDCAAGVLAAVIGETGDVYPCEMLDRKLGNLRDSEFDLKAVWNGEPARDFRRWVRRSGCFCTFETGVRTTLSFQPQVYRRMIGPLVRGR